MKRLAVAAAVAVWLGLGLSHAAFAALVLNVPFYSQDFDGLTSGPINGQDGWFGGASTDVVQSTVAVSGKALEAHVGPGRSSGSVPLTFSTTHAFQKVV